MLYTQAINEAFLGKLLQFWIPCYSETMPFTSVIFPDLTFPCFQFSNVSGLTIPVYSEHSPNMIEMIVYC